MYQTGYLLNQICIIIVFTSSTINKKDEFENENHNIEFYIYTLLYYESNLLESIAQSMLPDVKWFEEKYAKEMKKRLTTIGSFFSLSNYKEVEKPM